MLTDRLSGQQREVDITISNKIGDHEIIVSIEVIEHERPADIQWVEQLLMKHASLPTNKLVLVSKSGFTKGALDKAEVYGVKTVTVDEINNYNFGYAEGELINTRMNLLLPIVYLVFDDQKIFLSNIKLRGKVQGQEIDFFKFAESLVSKIINFKRFFQESPANHKQDFIIPLPLSMHPICFRYKKKDYSIEPGHSLRGYLKKFTIPIIFQIGRYRTDHVVFAESKTSESDERIIVVLPRDGKPGRAVLTVHGEEIELGLGDSDLGIPPS